MMKKYLICFSVLSLMLVSCSKKATQADEEALESVLKRNITAHNIPVDHKEVRATETGLDRDKDAKAVFSQIDYVVSATKSSLESFKIVEFSSDEAVVDVVIYKKTLERLASDERSPETWTLKKVKGDWRISNKEVGEPIPVTE